MVLDLVIYLLLPHRMALVSSGFWGGDEEKSRVSCVNVPLLMMGAVRAS